MTHIVYKRLDGTIAVTYNVPQEGIDIAVSNAYAAWNDIVSHRITEEELPVHPLAENGSSYFRDAWVDVDGKIQVDRQKAEEVQMNYIRAARDKKLAELDIKTMQGIDVQAEKQILRDIPQTFNLSDAVSLEDLKNKYPDILKVN